MESELRPLMEMGPTLARSEHSCGLELSDLKEDRDARSGRSWKTVCVCMGVWPPSALWRCKENFLCLFSRSLPFLQDIKLQVYSSYQGASVWTKPHLLGSVTDQRVSDARLNVPQAQRHAKLCQDTSNGAFHHEKTDGQSEKGQSLWQRNSSSPHPTPPPGPISPFTLLPLLLFHAIALTGKHSICGNIIRCLCLFN